MIEAPDNSLTRSKRSTSEAKALNIQAQLLDVLRWKFIFLLSSFASASSLLHLRISL